MRFPYGIATIVLLACVTAYALALADQIALIRIQRAIEVSGGEFLP